MVRKRHNKKQVSNKSESEKKNPFQKGTFEPGKSGNPGGRGKFLPYIRELAREQSEIAITTLANICRDEATPPAARVAAASALLDRGYGKPTQYVEDGKNPLDTLTEDEQQTLLNALQSLTGSEEDVGEGAKAPYH